MPRKKAGHPTWFKLRTERAEFLKSIPSATAVDCILNCFAYLENRVKPHMAPIDSVCFSVFLPDLEDAWAAYEQRSKVGFQPNDEGTKVRDRDTSYTRALETDKEPEPEEDGELDRQTHTVSQSLSAGGLSTPSFEDVKTFALAHGIKIEIAKKFFDLNDDRGWKINGQPIRNWKKLLQSWATNEKEEPLGEMVALSGATRDVDEDGKPMFKKVETEEGVEQWQRMR